jgi:Carboxypeptidase regulatory-like domain/TonB dependent receptor
VRLKIRSWAVVPYLLGLGLLWAPQLAAQSTFGSIIGVVLDASNAAVPGAKVEITNTDENISRTVETNAQGGYQALNLKPGKYKISARKEGFGSFQLSDVVLDSRQERRADITLSVAALTQAVEVTATAAVINTENGTISDTKGSAEVTQLPVNYRGATTSPLGALVAVPGVEQDSNGGLTINGGFPAMIDFTLDGISTANVRNNGANQNMYPSSELLAEFRVSSVNNNAEFAQVGDITVTTKSGSNDIHGSLFEYFQNAALDATTYGSDVKQAKVWNTFGGSVGGPVIIPGYNGKNKTFFFGDYETNRHPGSTLEQFSVPTAAMRAGNLAGLPGGDAVDPTTGLPFPNNQIPAGRISSVSSKLLAQVYPLPNFDSGSTFSNYRTLVRTPITTDGYDIRMDHYITSNQQVFGRWSWKSLDSLQSEGLLPSRTVNETDQNMILSYNYAIRPSVVNEMRFGFSRWLLNQIFPLNGVASVQGLGLTGLDLTKHPEAGAYPSFNFSDGTGFTSVGQGKVGNTFSRTYQFTDNLSWTKGRHSLKFGADFRALQYQDVLNFGGSDDFGSFGFNEGSPYSGNAYADFLLGIPSTGYFATTGPNLDQRAHHYGVYAQDEFRVNDRLTINLGMRWEFDPPFDETHGNITNFDLKTGNVIVPDQTLPAAASFQYLINSPCPGVNRSLPCSNIVSASSVGLPKGLHQYYWKNFDPRISVAWRPFGNKTVFRAGFGIFTMTSLGQLAWTDTGIHTTDARFYVNSGGNGVAPGFQFPQAVPGNGGLTPDLIGGEQFGAGVSTSFRDPQSAQWNVTIERELPSSYSIRASYIGMNSYRLTNMIDENQVRPSTTGFNPALMPYGNWSTVAIRENVGFANYQSLNLEVDHRMAKGLYLQASYVWAKNLTNAGADVPSSLSSEVGSGAVIADRFDLAANRGNDYATRRHRGLITAMYQLPFGKGRTYLAHSGKLVDGILGGWQISTVTMLETGPWLTPSISPSEDQSGTNILGRNALLRPDRIGNGNISNPTPDDWFDINAFAPTPAGAGRIGNAGVGILEGPGTVTVAGGLSKSFAIAERVRMRFEATFTNLLNHPNFAPPATNVSSPETFGKISSVQTGENAGNRTGQLALRIDF